MGSMGNVCYIHVPGADPGFSCGGGGGGRKRLCAPTHITSANPKVPYGQGPGPAEGPWKLSGFLMLSRRAI